MASFDDRQPDYQQALAKLRSQIDQIDAEIFELISKRMRVAEQIGLVKTRQQRNDPAGRPMAEHRRPRGFAGSEVGRQHRIPENGARSDPPRKHQPPEYGDEPVDCRNPVVTGVRHTVGRPVAFWVEIILCYRVCIQDNDL